MRRGLKLVSAAVVAAALTTSLSSCSSTNAWNVVDPADARLGDTVVALYFNPQIGPDGQNSAGEFLEPGHVVLVQADGSYVSIETAGMDVGQVTWTDAGLFFADHHQDYWLSDSLAAWPDDKPEIQVAALQVDDGRVLSVYNYGNTDEGYRMDVVTAHPGAASTLEASWGLNDLMAECDGTLFGLSEVIGPTHTRIAAERGVKVTDEIQRPVMLLQLHPAVPIVDSIRGLWAIPGAGFTGGTAPCEDGVIAHLVQEYPPEGEDGFTGPITLGVRWWDTEAGDTEGRQLVNSDGKPLDLDADQFAYSTIADDLTDDGRLLWYAYDGTVRATDPATGITETLWESGILRDETHFPQILFRGSWVYVLEVPHEQGDSPMVLTRYDRETGQATSVVTIPDLNQNADLQNVLRSMAVSPAWDKR